VTLTTEQRLDILEILARGGQARIVWRSRPMLTAG
jgi:hypothetical protein